MLTSFLRKLFRFLFGSKTSFKENFKLFIQNWYSLIKRFGIFGKKSFLLFTEKLINQFLKFKGFKKLTIIKENIIVSQDYNNLGKVSQTKNQIRVALQQSPMAISFIKDIESNKGIIKEEIEKNWESIQYLPIPNKELIDIAVKIDNRALTLIDKNWLIENMNNYELQINQLIKNDPSFILNFKTPLESTIKTMLFENNSAIKYLNKIQQKKYKPLIDKALLREPNMIVHVHEPSIDQMVTAINYNFRLFNSIKDKCISDKDIESLLQTDMRIYKNLPLDKKIKHQEIYNKLLTNKEIALKINELISRRCETILDFESPTDKMIKTAVSKEPSLYSKLNQTQTLTTQLIDMNPEVIKFVNNPTDNDFRRAFNNSPRLINNFLDNYSALKIAISLDHKNILNIPFDLRTGEIAEIAIKADPMNILNVKANEALYYTAIDHNNCSLDLLKKIPKSKITDKMLEYLKKENLILYLKYDEYNNKTEKTEFTQLNQKNQKILPSETNKSNNEISLIIN